MIISWAAVARSDGTAAEWPVGIVVRSAVGADMYTEFFVNGQHVANDTTNFHKYQHFRCAVYNPSNIIDPSTGQSLWSCTLFEFLRFLVASTDRVTI